MRSSSPYSLSLAFFLCFLSTYLFLSLLPGIRLFFFVPYLTLLLARLPLSACLWASLATGTLIDILSSSSPSGASAINYTLSSLFLYRYRRVFPEEKIFVFSLYTILYSLLSTLLFSLLYAFLEMRFTLHLGTILTDFIIIPLVDGMYALTFVFAPLALFAYSSFPLRLLYYKKWLQRYFKLAKKRYSLPYKKKS
ncbi:MAG: hypothetical protein JSR76_08485 [Verrucomicrobia bacterium]|nr:hypothetical protein [Verrucomicrobiota bacterium]